MAVEASQSQLGNVFKIILIGDSGVGKSGLLLRFTEDTFNENYHSTIGAEFKIKPIDLNGRCVTLAIWDTSGQERFRAITRSYYRKIHGIMMVYDITNKISYENLELWLEEITKNTSTQVRKILVGNKTDLARDTDVNSASAKNYADVLGIPYIQTSVKYSLNVEHAFKLLASEISKSMVSQQSSGPTEPAVTLSSNQTKKRQKECCNV